MKLIPQYQQWTNQDLSYWTSLNLKTSYTQKPYYKTYLYKLSFICTGITRWKNRIENFAELKQKYAESGPRPTWAFWAFDRLVPPDECLNVIVELAKFHKKHKDNIKIRTEHHWASIYTNDPALINEFLKSTNQYFNSKEWMLGLDKISIPAPKTSYSNENTVYKKKLPYNRYRYKAILSVSKKEEFYNRGIAFLQWASNIEDIYIPNNAIDSLENRGYAYGVIYFYCENETTLQMSQFLLGDSIKSIEYYELFDK